MMGKTMTLHDLLPNWTTLPVWVFFILSVVTLNGLVFKPTLRILAARRRKTGGLQQEVESFKEQTAVKMKEYEALMAEARTLARSGREEILREAEAQQAAILKQARAQAEAVMAKMQAEIATEALAAKEKLRQGASSLAVTIAEKLLERKVA